MDPENPDCPIVFNQWDPNQGASRPVDPAGAVLLETLTKRQREVFHWICEGKRDREIAVILGISYRTVTVHVRAILEKLEVENRTCAAMLGARFQMRGNDSEGLGHNTPSYVFILAPNLLLEFNALVCRLTDQMV